MTADRRRCHSFDVFDTAITRTLHQPDHLHWLIARHLKERALFQGGADEWRALRIEAEKEARRKSSREEISLNEIYVILSNKLAWSEATAERALEIELFIEGIVARTVHTILESHSRLSAAHEETAFISDTYFSHSYVVTLLEENGYSVDPSSVFVSSDVGLTKHSGNLYDYVKKQISNRSKILRHTGDNFQSDIFSARKFGVQSMLFEESQPTKYEKALFDGSGGGYIGSVIAGSARAARLSAPTTDVRDRALARIGAGVAGPLVAGYVLWVLLEARRQAINCVYFLARDGQVMKRLADEFCALFGWQIETRYMLASRQALLLPSLAAENDKISALTRPLIGSSMRKLLQWLDVPDASAGPALAAAGLTMDSRIGPEEDSQRRVLIVLRMCKNDIENTIFKESAALENYLRGLGAFEAETLLLVDVGWRGNLQLWMNRAIKYMDLKKRPVIWGAYFGLIEPSHEILSNVSVFCSQPPSGNLIETFCAADHISLASYRILDSRQEPNCELPIDDRTVSWGVRCQQSSMVTFTKNLRLAWGGLPPAPERLAESLKSASLAALQCFTYSPEPQDALTYGSVLHAADSGHSEYRELAPQLDFVEIAQMFLPSRLRPLRQQRDWVEASIARSISHDGARSLVMAAWAIRSKRPNKAPWK